jgi:hypothetical protein
MKRSENTATRFDMLFWRRLAGSKSPDSFSPAAEFKVGKCPINFIQNELENWMKMTQDFEDEEA